MEKQPLVSIIAAAYNEEKYISKLIDSLINQNYPNWELIIVDDNSKDRTYEVIQELAKKDNRIKVYQQVKGIKGPGNAWNLAVIKSKGKILFFEGADTMLGKEYINDMIKPILEKKTIGTLHKQEKIANKQNLWARSFGERNAVVDEENKGVIFGAILREYYNKAGGFDPKLGFADDQTLYQKLKIKSLGVDAEIYHHNPESFKEIWRHDKWVGASSTKPWAPIVIFPVFSLWVIYKSIKQFRKDPNFNFIWFLPVYNTIKYFGYLSGAVKKIITKKIY